jgi:hypothetical protein
MRYAIVITGLAMLALVFEATTHCQTRTYTNADLGKPITWQAPPPTPEMLASLATRAFHATPTPEAADGPHYYVVGQQFLDQAPPPYRPNNMSGPWDWPEPAPARRLDGTLLSDPVTIYGQQPWFAGPYFPRTHPRRR